MQRINISDAVKNLARFAAILLICAKMSYPAHGQQQRPNIIFIMSDDQASSALSSYGNQIITTPNIDRIAKQGMRFTNAFVVSSLCTPSRAAILSGKYSAKNGVRRIGEVFDGSQETFPKILQKAGYQTAIIGKWHLTSQPTGFDQYSVIRDQGEFFNPRFFSNGEEWTANRKVGGEVTPGYFTELITDKAIEWLNNRKSGQPFALLVHHKAPHEPYEFPAKYSSLFVDTKFPLPGTFNDDFKGKNHWLADGKQASSKLQYMAPNKVSAGSVPIAKPADIKAGTEEYKNWAYQSVLKGYYRLGASLDENVGRLLNYLEASGLKENTIIVYTSDNGWFLGEHGLRNKMWMYEEGLKVPLIISYPGHIPPNQVEHSLVSALDYAPTFLDYAHAKLPASMQGRSLKQLLEGKKPHDWRTAFFYHYYDQFEVPEHYGLRTRDYKLIRFIDSTKAEYEMYNLKADPSELHNVFNDPEYKKMRSKLLKKLQQEKKKFEG